MGNPESAARFVTRSLMLAEIRRFLQDRGFLEVETPMLQDIPGGAAARPFKPITSRSACRSPCASPRNSSSSACWWAASPRFSNSTGTSATRASPPPNPEFTMLEAYWAFSDFKQMAQLVQDLTCHLAEKFCGGLQIEHRDDEGQVIRTIDLTRPWRRANYHDLIQEVAGSDFFDPRPPGAAPNAMNWACRFPRKWRITRWSSRCSKSWSRNTPSIPVFVTRVASELVPLAKLSPGGKTVEVYELIINGQEISPGYSELNDPEVQRQRLKHQAGGEEEQKVDYDFIETLKHGIPPPAASASASTAW